MSTRKLQLLLRGGDADLLDFCETQSWRACIIGGLAVQRWRGNIRMTPAFDNNLFAAGNYLIEERGQSNTRFGVGHGRHRSYLADVQ